MSPSDPKSSQTTPLGFDEFIGILVAFATIVAILFWSFYRQDSSWNFSNLLVPKPTPSASPTSVQRFRRNVSSLTPLPTPAGKPDHTLFLPDETTPNVVSPPFTSVVPNARLNLKVPSSPSQVLSTYKDTKDIPDYATDKVAAATANDLVINYPNTKILAPNKEATRAEVAAMVHQALVQMGKLEPIQSQSIVIAPH